MGNGGSVSADVAGRELDLSLALRRLSGRGNGSSRRGGISCSKVSGKTVVAGVEGRPVVGRGSEASDDSKARLIGSTVPEVQFSIECGCPIGARSALLDVVWGGVLWSSTSLRMASRNVVPDVEDGRSPAGAHGCADATDSSQCDCCEGVVYELYIWAVVGLAGTASLGAEASSR